MRDKPDGFVCFDDGGVGNEGASDDLLEVLAAGAENARIGFEGRSFGNGSGTSVNDSLRNGPPQANKQTAYASILN